MVLRFEFECLLVFKLSFILVFRAFINSWQTGYVCMAACLELQCLPGGDWRCPCCVDKFCPDKKVGRPIRIQLTRAVKAPESEIGGCVVCRYVAAGLDFLL